MKIKLFILNFLCGLIILSSGCTDSTVIGKDLVDDNQLPITTVDTIDFRMNTLLSDDFLALNIQNTGGYTPLGYIEDPIFGKLSASFAFQLVEQNISSFSDTISINDIDSCVLNIPLVASGVLGDSLQPIDFTVYNVPSKDVFSDSEVKTLNDITAGDKIYANYNRLIPNKTVYAKVWTSDSFRIDTIEPRLNIKLNDDFKADIFPILEEILARDTSINANDSILFERMPGLLVQSNESGNAMALVDLTTSVDLFTVKVYYKKDGKTKEYPFSFKRSSTSTTAKFRRSYSYNPENSKVQAQLDAPNTTSDTVTYLLSPSGLMTELEFFNLDQYKGSAVAHAMLQIPVDSNMTYETASRIIPFKKNSVGDFVNVGSANSSTSADYSAIEGGILKKIASPISGQDSISVYELNLTSHFQTIIDGESSATLFLGIINRHSLSGFSILRTKVANMPEARLFLSTAKIP